MSQRAIEFVETWVTEHITAAIQPGGSQALAAGCIEASKAEGIEPAEIKDAFEDLTVFIAGEIEEARLSKKGG